jgi:hypothetical protein
MESRGDISLILQATMAGKSAFLLTRSDDLGRASLPSGGTRSCGGRPSVKRSTVQDSRRRNPRRGLVAVRMAAACADVAGPPSLVGVLPDGLPRREIEIALEAQAELQPGFFKLGDTNRAEFRRAEAKMRT